MLCINKLPLIQTLLITFLSQNFKSIAAALITVKQGVFMSVMIAYSKALSVSLKLGMV